MPDKLVTVASFDLAAQAHLCKARLEDEGIQCAIIDENLTSVHWGYSIAIGGIKVQVRQADAHKALQVLQRQPPGAGPAENEDTEEPGRQPRCPACDSTDVYYHKLSRRRIFLSILLLGFPIPFLRRKWVCEKCGHQWKAG